MMFRPLPDVEKIKHILWYDPLVGIFVWKNPPKEHARLTGWIAGSMRSGYSVIKINGVGFLSHRLAWKYFYGDEPKGMLDHKDGNKINNSISNIREATKLQNASNLAKRKNKILPKGVRSRPNGRFEARVKSNNVVYNLGSFGTVEEAHEKYKQKSIELFGEFWREK